MSEANIIEQLNRVDWSFPSATTSQQSIHSIARLPGNFVADIPAFLCEILTKPGQTVVDPFCGSGTTGIEAVRLGRNALLFDASPIAIEVTRAKQLLLTEPNIANELDRLCDRIKPWFNNFAVSSESYEAELTKWYHPETLTKLIGIWSLIQTEPLNCKVAATPLFYETLFDCAAPFVRTTATGKRRRHHWGWIADNVRPKSLAIYDVAEIFKDRVIHAIKVAHANKINSSTLTLNASVGDARSIALSDGEADAVITSPPYVSMIDYTLANRMAYYWNSWPLNTHLKNEIGARRYRNRPDALQDYLGIMEQCIQEIWRILKKGGYCAMVIGASTKHQGAVSAFIDLASQRFDLIWGPCLRNLSRNRVSSRAGVGTSESLVVFQK